MGGPSVSVGEPFPFPFPRVCWSSFQCLTHLAGAWRGMQGTWLNGWMDGGMGGWGDGGGWRESLTQNSCLLRMLWKIFVNRAAKMLPADEWKVHVEGFKFTVCEVSHFLSK